MEIFLHSMIYVKFDLYAYIFIKKCINWAEIVKFRLSLWHSQKLDYKKNIYKQTSCITQIPE